MENTCKKCLETKEINLFVKNKICKIGFENTCKKCFNEKAVLLRSTCIKKKKTEKEYREKTKEKTKKYFDEYYKKNKSKAIERVKNFLIKNPDYSKFLSKKTVEKITDSYVVVKLKAKGFKKEQISKELIEVQRIIIKTKRLCKTSQI